MACMAVIMIMATQTAVAAEPTGYYNNAYGKSDEALMAALCSIIRPHTEVSYSSGLLAAFKKADTDAQGYIIDIYSNCNYLPSDNGSSATTVGQGYNREHSFPRSWFGGEVAPMNTDVFHIYPTDIFVNGKRSNHPYGVCSGGTTWSNGNKKGKGRLGTCTYPGYSGTVFEPDDEYKGDLARSYFYMVTCYKSELPSWPGSAQLDYRTNRYKAFSTWTINMLMEWTRQDPVSEKEILRNEAIYKIQGNRNPFIDHPELAEFIWGNQQGKLWKGSSEEVPAAINLPATGSIIDLGTTEVGTELTYTISVKGQGLLNGVSMSMSDNEYFYVSKSAFTATEVNNGTSFDITFTADDEGTFANTISLYNDEAYTTFKVTATAVKQGDTPEPPAVQGDSIVEDWEGCATGGYWTKAVEGHAFSWQFTDAGIWGDNLKHGDLSCRLGKSSSSAIAMTQDVEGSSAIGFYAANFGSDSNATLRVDYSTDQGTSWATAGSVTTGSGSLQHFLLGADVQGQVRFAIVQTAGGRVNLDDITIYAPVSQPLIGDVNGDGEVSVADVNTLIDIILNGTNDSAMMKRADVNADGEVTVADIETLIIIILSA